MGTVARGAILAPATLRPQPLKIIKARERLNNSMASPASLKQQGLHPIFMGMPPFKRFSVLNCIYKPTI